MSGKKRSEVLGVIKNAASMRTTVFEHYFRNIEIQLDELKRLVVDTTQAQDTLQQFRQIYNQCSNSISELEQNLEKSSENYKNREFSEAERLLHDYKTLQVSLQNLSKELVQKKVQREEQNYANAKRKLQEIQQRVNTRQWHNFLQPKEGMLSLLEFYQNIMEGSDVLFEIRKDIEQIDRLIKENNAQQAQEMGANLELKLVDIEHQVKETTIRLHEQQAVFEAVKHALLRAGQKNIKIQYIDGKIIEGIQMGNEKMNIDIQYNDGRLQVNPNLPFNQGCEEVMRILLDHTARQGINLLVTDWGWNGNIPKSVSSIKENEKQKNRDKKNNTGD